MSLTIKAHTPLAADGSTPLYTVQGGEAQFGHNVVLGVLGSLGGGSLRVEICVDPISAAAPTNFLTIVFSLTVGQANTGLILPPGSRIRATLSGSTAPSATFYILE